MKATFLVLPLIALAACATTSKDSAPDGRQQGKQSIKMQRTTDCMFQSAINGFDALDDRYVLLYGMGGKQAYLAELTPGCFQITSQIALGAVDGDNNGQICGYGRDSLAYRDFGRTQECRIMSLERLSDLRLYEVTGKGPSMPKAKDGDKKQDEDRKPEDDGGD